MTLASKVAQFRLNLTIQECMIKLWTLRARSTKQKISEIQRENRKLNNSGKKH
jgi:hypothetical protein